ncbi:hypothetical protein ACFHYQ_17620 [Sphaerimonospora cavernae]|uniref:Uncharacterized protein n=1 Tax=Sphaerimonospora cavernae TaxID=1740611 RepID=A0ABV6U8Z1_9ACTN
MAREAARSPQDRGGGGAGTRAPAQAATLGRVVALAATSGPGHRLGLALTRAAGLLLTDDAA